MYPQALFEYIASLAPSRHRVWDCATGSGQAARSLAYYFDEVIATDLSQEQISHAVPVKNVTYRQAPSENSGIPSASVDAICIATALHWFDHGSFFKEAKRVLKPGGLFAAWTYGGQKVDSELDKILVAFESDLLGSYWSDRIKISQNGYKELAIPFRMISTPQFHQELYWSIEQIEGFLRSWSAVQRFKDKNGQDPVTIIDPALRSLWGDATRKVHWDLRLVAGFNDSGASSNL